MLNMPCCIQEVLDEAFHGAEDAYPAGSTEHRELLVRQCLRVMVIISELMQRW